MDKSEERKIAQQKLVRELPKGLVKWYPFKAGQSALYIKGKEQIDSAIEEALQESGMQVDCVETSTLDKLLNENNVLILNNTSDIHHRQYDYVVITSAVEQAKSIEETVGILKKARLLLKENGRLFLGMNNRLGIRYFCGDRDIYTGRNFDGIEGYVKMDVSVFDQMKGRCYAKAEIRQMLVEAGFLHNMFYSVFPVLERPQIMFADDYMPGEQLDIRISPQYNYTDTVFLEEEKIYDALVQNEMLHSMANAFWIECPLNGELPGINQITMSMDRGRKNAMFTIIRKDGYVEKRPAYEEGSFKLRALMENSEDLEKHGVRMVPMVIENGGCVMPYINAQSTLKYFRDLLLRDKTKFFQELDRFWEIILHSSEHVPYDEIDWENYAPGWDKKSQDDPLKDQWKKLAFGTQEERDSIGVILKKGYIDMIPLNSFYDGKDYIFYDQEMYVENLPAKTIMLRTIITIYMGNQYLERIFPAEELRERYGLNKCKQLFSGFTSSFLNRLRNDRILRDYHKMVRKNADIIYANRQRMNYSADEYDRIFRDIFRGTKNREIYLFGTGQVAERFLSQFKNDCGIAGFIDNNSEKWNADMEGIPIYPPAKLETLGKGTYKVIICIKNYMSVMEQLSEMGITDFSVYDAGLTYARPVTAAVNSSLVEMQEKKKYNVGYVAGVFDLFHVGHLNLLRRAKEQCNHLIVGVVTDEGVIKYKHTVCIVPFEERMEIVRSCRYVDEAVEIPLEYYDTDEAYRRYQFDVQFSGSDYADSPGWLAKKEFLQKRGSDLVFFPYTQSTSSTKIKELIKKKLL